MTVKLYNEHSNTGYLGWVENAEGVTVAFIEDNGQLQFSW